MASSEPDDLFYIDKDNLDAEWCQHAQNYYQAEVELAEAREDYERAKGRLDFIEGDLDNKIRRVPHEFGVEKVTDKSVEKAVVLQDRYREAARDVIEARKKMGIAQAYVNALDARKYALQDLVKLFLSGYWSSPRLSGELNEKLHQRPATKAVASVEGLKKARNK